MKIRKNRHFAWLASGLLVIGYVQPAFTQQKEPSTALPAVPAAYLLQAGDEISVSVNVAGYDSVTAIAPDGVVYLKRIGEIRAAGQTIPQLTEQIEKLLEKKLRRPRATVTLTKLAPPVPLDKITVVGSVLQPGPRELVEGLRVAKAIELANGAAKDADLSKVVIIHRDLSRKEIDLASPDKVSDPDVNVLLQGGDSVYVPAFPPKEVFNLTVSGAVAKAGSIQLEEAPRVLKAIELAGGAMKDADLSKITILRKSLKVEIVDLSKEDNKSDPSHNVLLADGDSVTIPSRFLTVAISGGVVNPGNYEIKPGWGLDDLILAAGKMTVLADTEHLQLRRKGEAAKTINLKERFQPDQPKLILEPGDEVIVPEFKNTVFIAGVGGVGGHRALTPGQTVGEFFRVPENAAVLDSRTMDLSKTELEREGMPAVKIDLAKIRRRPMDKQNVKLAAGDVIWLHGRDPANNSQSALTVGILGVLARFIAF